MALITIDALKSYLAIDVSNSDNDDILDTIIAYTGALISGYCNQSIELTDRTVTVDGDGCKTIMLYNFPVSAITSVRYRITPVDSWITLANGSDYVPTYQNGIAQIYFPERCIKGFSNYEITYSYGYSSIPFDIQLTAIEIATLIYKDSEIQGGSKGGRLGLASVSESINGISGSTSFQDYWNTKWKRVLAQYRKPII